MSPPAPPPGGYLLQPRPFILTGLPHRRDDTLRELTREAPIDRGASLCVTFLATDSRHPLPYGSDRALLAWITTRAFEDGTVRFAAINEYFQAFGLDPGGRSYRLFGERFQRLANLAIRIEQRDPTRRQVRRLFLIPAATEPLDWPPRAAAGLRLERYRFQLDEAFWHYLRDTRVPTPLALLRRFHNAPLAWDFAQLLLYRCYTARRRAVLPWPSLCHQLGATDRDAHRLKHRLARTLATIRHLYPDCPAAFLKGLRGLAIQPWRPPIPAADPERSPP